MHSSTYKPWLSIPFANTISCVAGKPHGYWLCGEHAAPKGDSTNRDCGEQVRRNFSVSEHHALTIGWSKGSHQACRAEPSRPTPVRLNFDVEIQASGQWVPFVNSRPDLFDPNKIKRLHGCHAFMVDLSAMAGSLIWKTTYWFGLFLLTLTEN